MVAHYMPWFQARPFSLAYGWHWTMNRYDPAALGPDGLPRLASHYHPTIGPYDSRDPDVIEYHALLMRVAGIDGIAVDWYGTSSALRLPAHRRGDERGLCRRRAGRATLCRVLRGRLDRGARRGRPHPSVRLGAAGADRPGLCSRPLDGRRPHAHARWEARRADVRAAAPPDVRRVDGRARRLPHPAGVRHRGRAPRARRGRRVPVAPDVGVRERHAHAGRASGSTSTASTPRAHRGRCRSAGRLRASTTSTRRPAPGRPTATSTTAAGRPFPRRSSAPRRRASRSSRSRRGTTTARAR